MGSSHLFRSFCFPLDPSIWENNISTHWGRNEIKSIQETFVYLLSHVENQFRVGKPEMNEQNPCLILGLGYSGCGPWSRTDTLWELIRNGESQSLCRSSESESAF